MNDGVGGVGRKRTKGLLGKCWKVARDFGGLFLAFNNPLGLTSSNTYGVPSRHDSHTLPAASTEIGARQSKVGDVTLIKRALLTFKRATPHRKF